MTAREFVQKALDDLGMQARVEDDQTVIDFPDQERQITRQVCVTIGNHSEMFDARLVEMRMQSPMADEQMQAEIKSIFASRCYACTFAATSECDHCGKGFCREHGDPGGDRDTESGTRAYPSTCEACRASYEREMRGGK